MTVLDTNVVSELMRATPDPDVMRWLASHSADLVATTAITVAEVRHGKARLPDGRRKDDLREAADDVHRAALATRNIQDFRDTAIEVVDPWRGPAP